MSIKTVFPYKLDIYLDPNDRTKVIAVIDRPKIPVRLNFNHKFFPITAPVQCLLDSGADVCFCSDLIGTWLGIQFNKIKKNEEFTAANGQTFKPKPVIIKIFIENINYESMIYFTDVLPRHTPIILG